MTPLLRQWPFLEAVLLPALTAGRAVERLAAWNLASVDDALAVALALLHRRSGAGEVEARVFHSGPPPERRPLRWRLADVRALPENPWLVPDAKHPTRWRPTPGLLESVLLGEPASPVDLVVAGGPAPLGRLREGGLLLIADPAASPAVPPREFRPVEGGAGRLFRKLTGANPAEPPADPPDPPPTLADHDQQARLVEDYTDLARSLARRFRHRGERPEDLEQVAVLALIRAAARYQPERGPFGPFAASSIVGELKRHFRDRMWMVKVPRSLQEMHLAVQATRQELTQALGASPSVGDIASHLGVSGEEVLGAMEVAATCWPASLDRPGRDGDDPVSQVPAAGDGFESSLDRRLVRDALPLLSPTERLTVVRLYFEGCSQRHVAAELGVSQMQVSRLMTKVLAKLRRSLGDPAAEEG